MSSDDETKLFMEVARNPRGELPSGALAGDYVIEDVIERGGCGAVYAAYHRASRAPVAVKVLHSTLASSPRMVQRFLREVEVVKRLEHPGIIAIQGTGELSDGRSFYVMERLEGVTLEGLLRAEGRVSPEQALELLEPVCGALDAAHGAGVIHRDVKASNIFVVSGPPRAVKLLDFGIAKLMTPDRTSWLTTAGRAPGTLTIMAPEQILGGEIDARVDVYALGVLLHRLLTGALPFYSKDATELARQHLEEPPPRPSQRTPLAPALDAIVLRCLEKEPDRRFGSVKSFLRELREAVGEPAVGRVSTPDWSVDAIAVHVELRLRVDVSDIDDALADDLGGVLDLAEELLRSAGLSVVSLAGEEILGMRLLDGAPADVSRGRQAVAEAASDLVEVVARRTGADERVHVNVCLNAGTVLVRTPHHPEITGGALARAGEWTPRQDIRGLCATPEAARGLTGFEMTKGPGELAILHRRDRAREALA